MNKLYTVEVKLKYVMCVDDGSDIHEVMRVTSEEAFHCEPKSLLKFDIQPIKTLDDLPEKWHTECVPYGSKSYSRISEYDL